MSNYISIEKVRENDIVIDEILTLKSNVSAFREGDIVSITEKIDGAQTHIEYNDEVDKLRCYSSSNELDEKSNLRGFYQYVQELDIEPFKRYPTYEFYGEWLVPHTVKYDKCHYQQWYLFSIKDKVTGKYLPQNFVKGFATKYQFNYVHELYFGPFLGWDHVYSFANSPHYGLNQEGIVIKNQTALEENREPFVLKYVNESFVETKIQNHMKKITDPNRMKEKSESEDYVRMIVTDARVRKMLHKLVDEGIVPSVIEPKDMAIISKHLPGRVYEDCEKEEPEILDKAGEYAKRSVCRVTMQLVKDIVTL